MALVFSGSQALVKSSGSFPSVSTLGYCFWFRLETDIADGLANQLLQLHDGSSGGHESWLSGNTDGTLQDLNTTGPGYFLTHGFRVVSVGSWMFLAVSISGGSVSAYRRSQTAQNLTLTSGTTTASFTPTALRVAENRFSASRFNGRIEALKVWSGVAPSAAEFDWESRRNRPFKVGGIFCFLDGLSATNAGTDLSGSTNSFSVTGTLTTEAGPGLLYGDTPIGAVVPAAAAGGAFTLTADAGAFALSGTDASLEYGPRVAADAGSFALAGTDASLEVGREVAAESGTFTLTGQDASLELGRRVAADSGSFSQTGTAASLERGYRVAADSGFFALNGTAANLEHGHRLVADSGAFVLNGQGAALNKGRSVIADPGSFALTGTAADPRVARRLIAASGAFALTGIAANLLYGSGALEPVARAVATLTRRAVATATVTQHARATATVTRRT